MDWRPVNANANVSALALRCKTSKVHSVIALGCGASAYFAPRVWMFFLAHGSLSEFNDASKDVR